MGSDMNIYKLHLYKRLYLRFKNNIVYKTWLEMPNMDTTNYFRENSLIKFESDWINIGYPYLYTADKDVTGIVWFYFNNIRFTLIIVCL